MKIVIIYLPSLRTSSAEHKRRNSEEWENLLNVNGPSSPSHFSNFLFRMFKKSMSSHLDISIAIMLVILLDILALISLGLFSAVELCMFSPCWFWLLPDYGIAFWIVLLKGYLAQKRTSIILYSHLYSSKFWSVAQSHTTSDDLEYSTNSHMNYFYGTFMKLFIIFLRLTVPVTSRTDCIENVGLDILWSKSYFMFQRKKEVGFERHVWPHSTTVIKDWRTIEKLYTCLFFKERKIMISQRIIKAIFI